MPATTGTSGEVTCASGLGTVPDICTDALALEDQSVTRLRVLEPVQDPVPCSKLGSIAESRFGGRDASKTAGTLPSTSIAESIRISQLAPEALEETFSLAPVAPAGACPPAELYPPPVPLLSAPLVVSIGALPLPHHSICTRQGVEVCA